MNKEFPSWSVFSIGTISCTTKSFPSIHFTTKFNLLLCSPTSNDKQMHSNQTYWHWQLHKTITKCDMCQGDDGEWKLTLTRCRMSNDSWQTTVHCLPNQLCVMRRSRQWKNSTIYTVLCTKLWHNITTHWSRWRAVASHNFGVAVGNGAEEQRS